MVREFWAIKLAERYEQCVDPVVSPEMARLQKVTSRGICEDYNTLDFSEAMSVSKINYVVTCHLPLFSLLGHSNEI